VLEKPQQHWPKSPIKSRISYQFALHRRRGVAMDAREKCPQKRYGINAKPFDQSEEITADCRRKIANKLDDLCGVRCPDLPKAL
jgi:hypothetical protein